MAPADLLFLYCQFQYALFDLTNDPYETTNLYNSTEDAHVTAKVLTS
jgi:hypothetical protein